MGVEVQHSCDKVFELFVEEAIGLAVLVSGPELCGAVRRQQLVVRVVNCRAIERWVTCVQNEEDDSEGEEVDNLALVGLLSVNLRSHEAERADVGSVHAGVFAAFDGASKTKVDDFDVVHFVEQDILALHVTVSEPFRVDVVDCLDQLLGVVANHGLLEGARVGYVVEKLATGDQLLDNVGHWHLLSRLLGHNRVLIEFEVLDDVFVFEGLHRVDLVLEQLEGALTEIGIVQAEDLDCVLVAILGRAELDLGAEA